MSWTLTNLQNAKNLSMLAPLIAHMRQHSPAQRPSAAEALAQWRKIRREMSTVNRRWRLRPRGEYLGDMFENDLASLVRMNQLLRGNLKAHYAVSPVRSYPFSSPTNAPPCKRLWTPL